MGSEDNGLSSLGERGIASRCRLGGGYQGRWVETDSGRRRSPEHAPTCALTLGWAVGGVRGSAEIRRVGSLKRGRLRKGRERKSSRLMFSWCEMQF